jgi:hypothetical protein
MKQTRQAVRDVKQSILLRCLWSNGTANLMKYKDKLIEDHSEKVDMTI